jgi:acyl-CoA thioesterase
VSGFREDTSVQPVGGGRYQATIDRGWWIERGPNGGYLAAIVLRAILAEVADAARRPRTLTLHYLRPPDAGACEVVVTTERAGRSLSTLSARLRQGGQDCVVALAAVGLDRYGPQLLDHPAPPVSAPDATPPRPDGPGGEPDVAIRHRYDVRPALGWPPFAEAPEAVTGGWIRPADHDEPVDDILLAALTDGWMPAIFARLPLRLGVPTVELTVHFRDEPSRAPGWCLVRFVTRQVVAGYLEESGEIWSEDGRLLAESRQLAAVLA